MIDDSLSQEACAGGRRIALRSGGVLSWLLGDHLGGTAVTVGGTAETGEVRYKAFGATRFTSGTMPTSVRFTGQREEVSPGLYDYNARWYDPALGQFLSPDTIVPDAGKALDYHRYAYTRFNPLKYTDPTGHCVFGLDTIVCVIVGGAVAGAVIGGGWYAVNESQQPDGLDLGLAGDWDGGPRVAVGNDWGDLGVAAAGGAVSGGMIASGSGIVIGIGSSIAANQVVDHGTNSLIGSDFSWQKHAMATATGAAAGVVAPGAGALAKGVPILARSSNILKASTEVIASGAVQGLINASGDYVLGASHGHGKWDSGTVGWGIVTAGVGQISRVVPNSGAWGAFSTISSETLSSGARLNVDLISSTTYQSTLASPIAPFSISPAP